MSTFDVKETTVVSTEYKNSIPPFSGLLFYPEPASGAPTETRALASV